MPLTAGTQIRLATDSDGAAIAEIYRPVVEKTTISFETEPPSEEEIRRRVNDTLAFYPWLVCDVDGRVAGYAYASKHRVRAAYQWSVDTSVYVHTDFRRHGIGRALYTSLFAILAAQGHFNAYAGIGLPNPASIALHEAVGFKPLGVYRNVGYKLGAWRDVGWWQLALRDHEIPPPQPIAVGAIQDRFDWDALLGRGLPLIRAGIA